MARVRLFRPAEKKLRFAALIRRGAEKLRLSRHQLAEKLNRSPEHVRKLLRGETFPGPDLQKRIAEVLQLDPTEFSDAVLRDRWLTKTGKKPPQPEPPTMPEVQRAWPKLSEDQKDFLVCVISCLARQTRRSVS